MESSWNATLNQILEKTKLNLKPERRTSSENYYPNFRSSIHAGCNVNSFHHPGAEISDTSLKAHSTSPNHSSNVHHSSNMENLTGNSSANCTGKNQNDRDVETLFKEISLLRAQMDGQNKDMEIFKNEMDIEFKAKVAYLSDRVKKDLEEVSTDIDGTYLKVQDSMREWENRWITKLNEVSANKKEHQNNQQKMSSMLEEFKDQIESQLLELKKSIQDNQKSMTMMESKLGDVEKKVTHLINNTNDRIDSQKTESTLEMKEIRNQLSDMRENINETLSKQANQTSEMIHNKWKEINEETLSLIEQKQKQKEETDNLRLSQIERKFQLQVKEQSDQLEQRMESKIKSTILSLESDLEIKFSRLKDSIFQSHHSTEQRVKQQLKDFEQISIQQITKLQEDMKKQCKQSTGIIKNEANDRLDSGSTQFSQKEKMHHTDGLTNGFSISNNVKLSITEEIDQSSEDIEPEKSREEIDEHCNLVNDNEFGGDDQYSQTCDQMNAMEFDQNSSTYNDKNDSNSCQHDHSESEEKKNDSTIQELRDTSSPSIDNIDEERGV